MSSKPPPSLWSWQILPLTCVGLPQVKLKQLLVKNGFVSRFLALGRESTRGQPIAIELSPLIGGMVQQAHHLVDSLLKEAIWLFRAGFALRTAVHTVASDAVTLVIWYNFKIDRGPERGCSLLCFLFLLCLPRETKCGNSVEKVILHLIIITLTYSHLIKECFIQELSFFRSPLPFLLTQGSVRSKYCSKFGLCPRPLPFSRPLASILWSFDYFCPERNFSLSPTECRSRVHISVPSDHSCPQSLRRQCIVIANKVHYFSGNVVEQRGLRAL